MTSPTDPDEQLAQRAQAGDRDACGQLLTLVRPEVEVFLRLHGAGRFRTRESLDDVLQSVFAECLTALDGFESRGPGSFRAWLRRVALHKLVSKHRYHSAAARDLTREIEPEGTPLGRFADSLHQLPTPSQVAIRHEEAELLERALQQLPEDQRQVVTMARLFCMPHAEIGEVLGKSEAHCRVLMSRGLVRLTGLMQEWEDGGAEPPQLRA